MTTIDPSAEQDFEIRQVGNHGSGCDCCPGDTNRVWGYVYKNNDPVAAYFVTWAAQEPDEGASFEFVLGKWGDETSAKDRASAAVDFSIVEGAPQFKIVDAGDRPVSKSSLAEKALARSEIVDTPIAPDILAMIDVIYQSESVSELRDWSAAA